MRGQVVSTERAALMTIGSTLCAALILSSAGRLAPSAPAQSATSWLSLDWPAVDGCPSQAEVISRARQLADGGTPQALEAAVTITVVAGVYTVTLAYDDPQGREERALSSPSCGSLGDAVALILVVAADPVSAAERFVAPLAGPEEGEPELEPPQPQPLSVSPSVSPSTMARAPTSSPTSSSSSTSSSTSSSSSTSGEPLAPSSPSPARQLRWPKLELGATIAGGLGPSQALALGFSGGVGLVWPRARVELRGSYWLPSRAGAPDRADVGADLTLAAGAARAGPRWAWNNLSLALLGGVELGALTAEGFGFSENRSSRGLWAAGLLGPRFAWQPLRWLSLGLEVEGLAAITRRTYAAVGSDEILYTVPLAGVRIAGGLAFVLP